MPSMYTAEAAPRLQNVTTPTFVVALRWFISLDARHQYTKSVARVIGLHSAISIGSSAYVSCSSWSQRCITSLQLRGRRHRDLESARPIVKQVITGFHRIYMDVPWSSF